MDNIVDLITKNKLKCYFISPHLDDAVLSCGDLISYLSDKTDVEIITVFTKADSLNTLSAKAFLKNCGFKDAKTLFHYRNIEDEQVCKSLNVKYQHLGFIDASWRKYNIDNKIVLKIAKFVPELIHIYPIYRNIFRNSVVSGKVNKSDQKLASEIKKQLQLIISQNKKSVIFAPIGLGNHVDHVLVNQISEQLSNNVVFWSDFPYDLNNQTTAKTKHFLKTFYWSKNIAQKKKLILGYKTQVDAMFPDKNIPLSAEKYYQY